MGLVASGAQMAESGLYRPMIDLLIASGVQLRRRPGPAGSVPVPHGRVPPAAGRGRIPGGQRGEAGSGVRGGAGAYRSGGAVRGGRWRADAGGARPVPIRRRRAPGPGRRRHQARGADLGLHERPGRDGRAAAGSWSGHQRAVTGGGLDHHAAARRRLGGLGSHGGAAAASEERTSCSPTRCTGALQWAGRRIVGGRRWSSCSGSPAPGGCRWRTASPWAIGRRSKRPCKGWT